MKSNDHHLSSDSAESNDPRQALIDAMLREHARLGTGNDETLLAAVRSRTVEKPVATRVVDLPFDSVQRQARQPTSAREWMQVAAVVAILIAGVGFFLSQRPVSQVERTEQTFQLVSRPLTAVAVPTDAPPSGARKAAPGDPKLGEFTLPNLAHTELAPSGNLAFPDATGADPVSRELLAEFSVSAEKILHASADRLVYQGGVVLRHPDFTLKADRLELSAAPGDSRVGAFMAEGDDLKIEKRSANGTIEVAHADTATWDADGARLILAGSPTLTAGNSFVRPHTSAGIIVLQPDGYQVIER